MSRGTRSEREAPPGSKGARRATEGAGGDLRVCLDRALALKVIRAMAPRKPARVVRLDVGFARSDQLKTNAVQTFKTKGLAKFQTV